MQQNSSTRQTFSLAIPFDDKGRKRERWTVNPIHFMLQDGGDIVAGAQDHLPHSATRMTR